MVRICVNVLVGIPAAGKSTYCQQLAIFAGHRFEVVHICYDSYIRIDREYDTFSDVVGLYRARRQKVLSCVEAIMIALKENNSHRMEELLVLWKVEFKHALNVSTEFSDYVFLIDDNNYYRSMRVEWLRVARRLSVGYFETHFITPLPVAVQRNRERVRPIDEGVINRMWTRLEKPCGSLYEWEETIIAVQLEVNFESIIKRIQHSFENPQNLSSAGTVAGPMEQSKVHKLDIILRKTISKKIIAAKDCMPKTEFQSFVKMLQERKTYILQQIRAGARDVPEEMLVNVIEDLI